MRFCSSALQSQSGAATMAQHRRQGRGWLPVPAHPNLVTCRAIASTGSRCFSVGAQVRHLACVTPRAVFDVPLPPTWGLKLYFAGSLPTPRPPLPTWCLKLYFSGSLPTPRPPPSPGPEVVLFRLPSHSMSPSLLPGPEVVLFRLPSHSTSPSLLPGPEVVLFRLPHGQLLALGAREQAQEVVEHGGGAAHHLGQQERVGDLHMHAGRGPRSTPENTEAPCARANHLVLVACSSGTQGAAGTRSAAVKRPARRSTTGGKNALEAFVGRRNQRPRSLPLHLPRPRRALPSGAHRANLERCARRQPALPPITPTPTAPPCHLELSMAACVQTLSKP